MLSNRIHSSTPHAPAAAATLPTPVGKPMPPARPNAHPGYAFMQGLDYSTIVAASEKVAWTVDEVFRGRLFDSSRPIVPESWVRTRELEFLDDEQQFELNRCRAFSYVHLLGNFEEFVPLHLAGVAQRNGHAERAQLRVLFRFGDEEMKHQQLFRRAELTLERACGHSFGRHFDEAGVGVAALTDAILTYDPLARFLMALAFEWGTQRHYVESVRDQAEDRGDPLYVDVLKGHWIEEAQHVKADTLEIGRMAGDLSQEKRSAAFDDVISIGNAVDAAFMGQAEKEVETLESVTGRAFSAGNRKILRDTLCSSLREIMAGVGMAHPNFVKVAREVSREGAAKLGL